MALKRAVATGLGGLIALGGGLVNALGLAGPLDYLVVTSDLWSTVLIMGGRFLAPSLGLAEYQDAIVIVGVVGFVLVTAIKFAERTEDWLRK